MALYQIKLDDQVVDRANCQTDAEAEDWLANHIKWIMHGRLPYYEQFADEAECRRRHTLERVDQEPEKFA